MPTDRHALRALGSSALLATACGGSVVFDAGDGSGGSPGDTATVGPSVTVTSSQGSGGLDGGIVPTIEQVGLGANCQPVVGPDPIGGVVRVRYDSSASSTQALTLASAQVLFASSVEGWVFPIELDPTSSGDVPPGGTVTVEHLKVATLGDSAFVCQLCGMPGTVTLSYVDAVGAPISASADFELGCAF